MNNLSTGYQQLFASYEHISASYRQVHNMLSQSLAFGMGLFLLVSVIATPVSVTSNQLGNFDPGGVIPTSVLYGLPLTFSSAQGIQSYLETQSSVLAGLSVQVNFEDSDLMNNPNHPSFSGLPPELVPANNLAPYKDQYIKVSELIWLLTQGNLANGCSLSDTTLCYNNTERPINPAFILAMIQKESGLVYGYWARQSLDNAEVQFRLDRVLGYYCFENPDRTKSCYDENPSWRFFKGFFRQTYYAIRLLRLWEQRCERGIDYAFSNGNGLHYVGGTVTVSGQTFQLNTGIACAMYVYTPHVSSQRLVYDILVQLQADKNLSARYGYDPSKEVQTYGPVGSGNLSKKPVGQRYFAPTN